MSLSTHFDNRKGEERMTKYIVYVFEDGHVAGIKTVIFDTLEEAQNYVTYMGFYTVGHVEKITFADGELSSETVMDF